jgi:hypothetical protein
VNDVHDVPKLRTGNIRPRIYGTSRSVHVRILATNSHVIKNKSQNSSESEGCIFNYICTCV